MLLTSPANLDSSFEVCSYEAYYSQLRMIATVLNTTTSSNTSEKASSFMLEV